MPRAKARPRPTVVLLVRHGHTPTTGRVLPGRAPGLHLSDDGQRQAKAVADTIAGLPKVDAIYSSPLERTRETAQFIADARNLSVKTDKGLLECDIGDWTGDELKVARRRPEWKAVQGYPSGFRFPGGESFPELQQRMIVAVERLVQAHAGGVVVAVSHADPIRAFVAHTLGVHIDLFQRIVISPCSVTTVSWGTGPPLVLSVNATSDLRGAVPA